jgi:6-bladed beta-propeller protein
MREGGDRMNRGGWVVLILLISACADGDAPGFVPIRDTLPNGAERVRYEALPDSAATLTVDLRIGAVEGEDYEVFGDVRGVEADAEGNIYVLDYLASEIRVFGRDGSFLNTISRKGEGPGEITEANGMVFDSEGTLWVQDYGKWLFVGLSPEGEEVGRVPMPALNYGYMWNGALDEGGRFWKPTSHSDRERTYPPETGLIQASGRSYWKYIDPAVELSDSIYMGELTRRTFIAQTGGGYSYRGVPFDPSPVSIVDPAGGFWMARTDAYRVVHRTETGDTTLVIEADVAGLPVTDADKDRYIEVAGERGPDQRRVAAEVAGFMPSSKPVLASLRVDDEGLLWVQRVVAGGETPLYDIFDRGGEYLGSVRLAFQPARSFPPRIRNGQFYTVVLDELDVPSVVRGSVPEFRGR